MENTNELLTREMLAKRMNCHPRTIIKYEKKGLPVHLHIGKSPRYKYEEVLEWFVNFKPEKLSKEVNK